MFEKFLGFVAVPMGIILNWIYENVAFHNYGLAIIIFTLVIRFALMPLLVKQHKSTAKMQTIQPKINELQAKYKGDPQTLNMELAKIYKENDINPLGGCLSAIIQMPVLFSLLYVIGKPLTYMKRLGVSEIQNLVSLVPEKQRVVGFYEQISAVTYHNILNMDFLGMNLGNIPTLNFDKIFNSGNTREYLLLLSLPILATVTTYISVKLGMNSNKVVNNTNDKIGSTSNTMIYITTISTLIFSFQFPAGLSIYWLVGNLFQIVQQLYINKYVME